MRKAVKNCRSLNMQTIRLRRGRPSSIAVALALAITMAVIYLLSLQSCPKDEEAAAAAAMRSTAEIRMEGMEAQFLLSSIHDDETQARVAAAMCAQSGGAGLVLPEDNQYAVVFEAGDDFSAAEAPVIHRSCSGLTLKIDGPAGVTAALSDGLGALYSVAQEAGSLAASLEKGETDAKTASALLSIWRTQMEKAVSGIQGQDAAALAMVEDALKSSLARMDAAMAQTEPGALRTAHAAGCLEWINLAKALAQQAKA